MSTTSYDPLAPVERSCSGHDERLRIGGVRRTADRHLVMTSRPIRLTPHPNGFSRSRSSRDYWSSKRLGYDSTRSHPAQHIPDTFHARPSYPGPTVTKRLATLGGERPPGPRASLPCPRRRASRSGASPLAQRDRGPTPTAGRRSSGRPARRRCGGRRRR